MYLIGSQGFKLLTDFFDRLGGSVGSPISLCIRPLKRLPPPSLSSTCAWHACGFNSCCIHADKITSPEKYNKEDWGCVTALVEPSKKGSSPVLSHLLRGWWGLGSGARESISGFKVSSQVDPRLCAFK